MEEFVDDIHKKIRSRPLGISRLASCGFKIDIKNMQTGMILRGKPERIWIKANQMDES